MGLISNGTTLLDAGALDSGVATGAMILISICWCDIFVHVAYVYLYHGEFEVFDVALVKHDCSVAMLAQPLCCYSKWGV